MRARNPTPGTRTFLVKPISPFGLSLADDASDARSLGLRMAPCEMGFHVGLTVTPVAPRFIRLIISRANGGVAFSRSPAGVGVTPTQTFSYL